MSENKKTRKRAAVFKQYMAGATLADLKKKFGIRGKSHLAGIVLDILIHRGKLPPVARGAKHSAEAPKAFTVSVNRRGTIVLPKAAVVDSFRANPGEAFVIKKHGRKIILTAVGS